MNSQCLVNYLHLLKRLDLIFLLSGAVEIGTLIVKQLYILFNLNLNLNTLGLQLPTLPREN